VPRFIVVLKDPPLALCGGSPGLAPTAVAARRAAARACQAYLSAHPAPPSPRATARRQGAVARGSITTTPPWLLAPA
jgi:hypothetical protein